MHEIEMVDSFKNVEVIDRKKFSKFNPKRVQKEVNSCKKKTPREWSRGTPLVIIIAAVFTNRLQVYVIS